MNPMPFLLLAGLVAASAAPSAQAERATVLPFEFIDEMQDPATQAGDQARLALIRERFPQLLAACEGIVVLPAPGAELEKVASQIAYVHQCNGCAEDFAKATGADVVVFTWVQKVSNLIINLNAEVQDAGNRTLDVRSVDMRGNTEASWLRAASALAKRLCMRIERSR